MTGLTEEIIAHLVECRVKRVVLLLDVDEAGRAAAIDMAQRLTAVNIEARSVELPAKDAAEFIAGGGLVDELRRLITESADSSSADASAARAVRVEASGPAALSGAMMMQLETSNDGSILLGHHDLNTTELYTHLELQDLKQAIQCHSAEPKNSLAVKCEAQIFPL